VPTVPSDSNISNARMRHKHKHKHIFIISDP